MLGGDRYCRHQGNGPMDNRKLLIFGFIACVLAAMAYTFVFADLPFVTSPTSPDGAPLQMPAPAPAQQPAP